MELFVNRNRVSIFPIETLTIVLEAFKNIFQTTKEFGRF